MAKGRDNRLFSNTIEASLRDPDLVPFFASSMTRRRVNCYKGQILHTDFDNHSSHSASLKLYGTLTSPRSQTGVGRKL